MRVRNFPGDWLLRKKCKILKESLITNSHEGNIEEENKLLRRLLMKCLRISWELYEWW
jgi:hypothetical protein